jgi:hypothetical protein
MEYMITCTHYLPRHAGHLSCVDPWALAAIAPCPNCGGRLLWAEAGYVPGYRICERCGRSWLVRFRVDEGANTTLLRLEIPDTSEGPEWSYGQPDASEEAYRWYAERVEQFGGHPFPRAVWAHFQGAGGKLGQGG